MTTDSIFKLKVQSIQHAPRPDVSGDLFRLKPRWRETGLTTPPATENLLAMNPNEAAGYMNTFKLDRVWCDWLKSLNTERAWNLISAPWGGIFNATSDPDWYVHGTRPTYNAVGFDGNIIKKRRISRSWMYIETIRVDILSTPPDIDFFDTPWLVHEFTAVNIRGELSKAGNGVFIQCPLFSNQEVALPLTELEPWTPDSPPLP